MSTNKKLVRTFFVMISLIALFLICSPIAQAQNWVPMAPYNTLWPLWSPALSPIDAVSGLPVPIVNQLTFDTVLPVQPGLTWDPAAANPWLLYNTPIGMAYYDPIGGVNMWPAPYLLDPAGSPLPLSLPTDYGFLPPTASSWINTNVPLGNSALLTYLMTLPSSLGLGLGLPAGFPGFGGLPPVFLAPSALLPLASWTTPTPILPPLSALLPPPTVLLPPPTVLLPPPSALLPPPSILLPPPTILLPPPSALLPSTSIILPPPTVLLPPPSALLPTTSIILPPPTVLVPPVTTVAPAVISGLLWPFI